MAKKNNFTSKYKQEIVRLVTELGKKPSDVAQDIGVIATTARRWVNEFAAHGAVSFPGKGSLLPADAERGRKRDKPVVARTSSGQPPGSF